MYIIANILLFREKTCICICGYIVVIDHKICNNPYDSLVSSTCMSCRSTFDLIILLCLWYSYCDTLLVDPSSYRVVGVVRHICLDFGKNWY